MKNFVINKSTFEIVGEVDNDVKVRSGYNIIKANNIAEASRERTILESVDYNDTINVIDLLTIINSMERIHGSVGIDPQILKERIKKL